MIQNAIAEATGYTSTCCNTLEPDTELRCSITPPMTFLVVHVRVLLTTYTDIN